MQDKLQFEEAIYEFATIIEYKDSLERYVTLCPTVAIMYMEKDDYARALEFYEFVSDYGDFSLEKYQIKYDYVINHKSKFDDTTMEYLDELRMVGFLDSESLFDALTKWNVDFYVNTEKNDYTTSAKYASVNKTLAIHFRPINEIDNEKIKITVVIELPDGTVEHTETKIFIESGEEYCVYRDGSIYGKDSTERLAGPLLIEFYNTDTEAFLGSFAITLTK